MTHTCNPIHSGGSDEEEHSSKPAWASSSQDLILKKTHHKEKADGLAQGISPEFKIQDRKKNQYSKLSIFMQEQ
jgi:hypothetical protein